MVWFYIHINEQTNNRIISDEFLNNSAARHTGANRPQTRRIRAPDGAKDDYKAREKEEGGIKPPANIKQSQFFKKISVLFRNSKILIKLVW